MTDIGDSVLNVISAEEARLRTAGVGCDIIIIGRGGREILLDDLAGSPVELLIPAAAP